MVNGRKIACDALVSVGKDLGYSNLVLQRVLSDKNISGNDKPFITSLFYGVLDRKITLDYVISQFIRKPIERITPITLNALRIALFQILYLDKVPSSAAVNESVKIVKGSKEKYNAGFVNAVLRSFLREGVIIPEDNSINSIKIRFSCPEWIIGSFINDYGINETLDILNHFLTAPEITVRINSGRITDEDFINTLEISGVKARLCFVPHAAVFSDGADIKSLGAYKQGLFYVQDLPSQIAVSKLGVKAGNRVLDMCAAPGGKSFSAALSGESDIQITACDYLESRVNLIRNGAERLQIDNINCIVNDSSVFNDKLGTFDNVICDVPCSGLGVIRRKPEIKYKTDIDLETLKVTQIKILENGLKYLRRGGSLMYSTCTIRRAENEDIVRACLDKHPDFELEYERTFLPGKDKTDGFYFAIIKCR